MLGWKSRRDREHEQLLATLAGMQSVMLLQAKALERMLKGFEVTSLPEARVMNDEAEWRLDQERMEAAQGMSPAMPVPNFLVMKMDG